MLNNSFMEEINDLVKDGQILSPDLVNFIAFGEVIENLQKISASLAEISEKLGDREMANENKLDTLFVQAEDIGYEPIDLTCIPYSFVNTEGEDSKYISFILLGEKWFLNAWERTEFGDRNPVLTSAELRWAADVVDCLNSEVTSVPSDTWQNLLDRGEKLGFVKTQETEDFYCFENSDMEEVTMVEFLKQRKTGWIVTTWQNCEPEREMLAFKTSHLVWMTDVLKYLNKENKK